MIGVAVAAALISTSISTPTVASADPPPGDSYAGPLALNVPGSMLTGISSPVDGFAAAEVGALLGNNVPFNWKWVTDPSLAAVAGTLTTTPTTTGLTSQQLQVLSEMEDEFRPPATKFGRVSKLVGGGAKLAFAVSAGVALGSSVNRLFGLDVTGGLCSGGAGPVYDGFNTVLAGLTFSDCDAWHSENDDPNTDIPPQLLEVGSQSCWSAGCVTIYGFGYGSATGTPYYCLAETSGTGAMATPNASYYPWGDGTYWWLGGPPYQGTTQVNCSELEGALRYSIIPFELNGPSTYPVVWRATETGTVVNAAPAEPDPTRTFECHITLTTGEVLHEETQEFSESDETYPTPVCPAIGPSDQPVSISIFETSRYGDRPMFFQNVTSEYSVWRTTYPECLNGSCLLDLRRSAESCFSDPEPCADWFSDPSRASIYQCYYGTHLLALSECYVYRPTFDEANVSSGHGYANPSDGTTLLTQTTPTEADRLTLDLLRRGWDQWDTEYYALGDQEEVLAFGTMMEYARLLAAQCVDLDLDDECRKPIFSPGIDIAEAAIHDLEAIAGLGSTSPVPQPALLHWAPAEDRAEPQWYRDVAPCDEAYPITLECDEYPYRSTAEGGVGSSLMVIDKWDNYFEGGYLNHFYSKCAIPNSEDREFVVVPLLTVWTSAWC